MAFRYLIPILLFLIACTSRPPRATTPTPFQPLPLATPFTSLFTGATRDTPPSPTPELERIWITPAAPPQLRRTLEALYLPVAERAGASLILDLELTQPTISWVYALAGPFPTLRDGVTFEELQRAWRGESLFNGHPLLMDPSTRLAFTAKWGEPGAAAVIEVAEDSLLKQAWEQGAFAILPFEALEPRWKVLAIDGQSPIQKAFDPARYPLQIGFRLSGPDAAKFILPSSNRQAEKLTTLVLTGVTALVRATAYRMEQKGVLYPGEAIGHWLREADLAHINNEVPFFSKCPPPNPNQASLIFCSSPQYIDLFLDLGIDLIELSGDHFNDYGREAMEETLALYRQKGLVYYGGGSNLKEALQPLLIEHNGNRLAFIGCNVKEGYAKATETSPGAAPCLWDYLTERIRDLRRQGFLVMMTFQHQECYAPVPCYGMVNDFHTVAESGATIISGSQAHFPQQMEFYNGAFIHYGLGNLFFDQDERTSDLPLGVRNEFLDRHVFYDGRHISTELLTAILEDLARPRPMTPEERRAFLEMYFRVSGWTPVP
ncbi:MAG: CapA family protein [Anaerolineales bacterium]